jgi:hypothetical protein
MQHTLHEHTLPDITRLLQPGFPVAPPHAPLTNLMVCLLIVFFPIII